MVMPIIQISSDALIPIENHFRVSAGPGAGKTYWLIKHIRNVLHQSTRLCKTRKIACITYTNVAVETILKGLPLAVDNVEVSTIHSFLYKHVMKPYVHFIANDYFLNVKAIEGHDDTVLSNYSFLKEWKDKTGQQRITEDAKVVEAIKKSRWRFDDSGNLIVKPDYPMKANGYNIRNDSYLEYKKLAWNKGIIHHDDVLFFGYQLIVKYPFILQVLRAKFPYFYIDEFQDTNPIQTKILEQIAQEETIVGIIGDKAQSIYNFLGATPSQFSSFNLPNISDYQIVVNRRCTKQLVKLLNIIRKDICQEPFRSDEGEKSSIIVGKLDMLQLDVQEHCKGEEVCALSWDNITSNAMKRKMNSDIPDDDLLQALNEVDSDNKRKKIVIACIKATELARNKRFKEAIKELERVLLNKKDNGRKEALKMIISLIRGYDHYKDKSLFDYYEYIRTIIVGLSRLTKGKARTFFDSHSYQQLAVCVNIIEDQSLNRTIHKAKGAEFDNVLLVLRDEEDLEFILNPNLDNNEEHRIYYVAVSRARNRLFISVPSLAKTAQDKLEGLFNITVKGGGAKIAT